MLLVDNEPAAKDIATCGGGFDRVFADRKDLVAPDCERVRIVHGSREEVCSKRKNSSRPSRRASSKACSQGSNRMDRN